MSLHGIAGKLSVLMLLVASVLQGEPCRSQVLECVERKPASLPAYDIYAIVIDTETIQAGELIELLSNRTGRSVGISWPDQGLLDKQVSFRGRHGFWESVLMLSHRLDVGFCVGDLDITFDPKKKPPKYHQFLGPLLDTLDIEHFESETIDGKVLNGDYIVRNLCALEEQGQWCHPLVSSLVDNDFRTLVFRSPDLTEVRVNPVLCKSFIQGGWVCYYKLPKQFSQENIEIICLADLSLSSSVREIQVSSLDGVPSINNPTKATVEVDRKDSNQELRVTVGIDIKPLKLPKEVSDSYRILWERFRSGSRSNEASDAATQKFQAWQMKARSFPDSQVIQTRLYNQKKKVYVRDIGTYSDSLGVGLYRVRCDFSRFLEDDANRTSLQDLRVILYYANQSRYAVRYKFQKK